MICQDLEGKVAVVTGSARGIGYAIAEALCASGVAVVVNDLSADATKSAADRLSASGLEAAAAPGDVSKAESARGVVETAITRYGRLDVLVNNAGVLRPTPAEQTDDSEWHWILEGNLTSTFFCCRAAIPHLQQGVGGSIINMSSSAGKSASTIGGPHYTAAKAGVLGLTRHLARELGKDNIRVNAVCPGLIDTEMVRSTIGTAQIAKYAASFPLRRLGTPEEVARVVAFLASSGSSYITGASVDVNGGDLTV